MARLSRLTVPGYPHHVLQRGNNGQAVFIDGADYEYLCERLMAFAQRERVALHSYVLMSDSFQLLLTPETENGLSRLMQGLGRAYVQYFNRRYLRTGTLWEGRYKATLLQPEPYLIDCMAYLDLSPVLAGQVGRAADYRWSSHLHYAGLSHDKRLVPHPQYWQLGNTPFAREAAYTQQVAQGLPEALRQRLGNAVAKGWALGDPSFLADLQKQTARRLVPGRAGRPRKEAQKVPKSR